MVAGQGACTNSSFADQYELGVHYAPIADFDLLMAAVESARELGVKPDSVRMALTRARRKARRLMESQHNEQNV